MARESSKAFRLFQALTMLVSGVTLLLHGELESFNSWSVFALLAGGLSSGVALGLLFNIRSDET